MNKKNNQKKVFYCKVSRNFKENSDESDGEQQSHVLSHKAQRLAKKMETSKKLLKNEKSPKKIDPTSITNPALSGKCPIIETGDTEPISSGFLLDQIKNDQQLGSPSQDSKSSGLEELNRSIKANADAWNFGIIKCDVSDSNLVNDSIAGSVEGFTLTRDSVHQKFDPAKSFLASFPEETISPKSVDEVKIDALLGTDDRPGMGFGNPTPFDEYEETDDTPISQPDEQQEEGRINARPIVLDAREENLEGYTQLTIDIQRIGLTKDQVESVVLHFRNLFHGFITNHEMNPGTRIYHVGYKSIGLYTPIKETTVFVEEASSGARSQSTRPEHNDPFASCSETLSEASLQIDKDRQSYLDNLSNQKTSDDLYEQYTATRSQPSTSAAFQKNQESQRSEREKNYPQSLSSSSSDIADYYLETATVPNIPSKDLEIYMVCTTGLFDDFIQVIPRRFVIENNLSHMYDYNVATAYFQAEGLLERYIDDYTWMP